MNRVLIVCNTVLQIIFAVNLRFTEFKDDEVDLIISDHTNNAKVIAENSRNLTAFSKVYYVKSNKLVRRTAALESNGKFGFIKDEFNKEKILHQYIKIKKQYDVLLAANPDKFTNLLCECLLRRNPQLNYFMYEDGLSAYCVLGETLKRQRHARVSGFHHIFNCLIQKKYPSKYVKGLYLFEPELCTWDDGIQMLRMEKINRDNEELLNTLNEMVGYKELEDHYPEKYIFFEESYSVESTQVNDIALVEHIAAVVGRENIKVKIHPRNSKNRFKNLGFKTNINTFIPWELIMLNEKLEDKIMISIASGSMANPYIIMGMKTKSVVLMKCAKGDFGRSGNIYNKFLYEEIYKKNPQVFFVPSDLNELDEILDKLDC